MVVGLECRAAWIPQPTERHCDVLGRLLGTVNVAGNLTPDAHLAALAIEHGLTLCSTDGDFARFPNLRWQNPLQQSKSGADDSARLPALARAVMNRTSDSSLLVARVDFATTRNGVP